MQLYNYGDLFYALVRTVLLPSISWYRAGLQGFVLYFIVLYLYYKVLNLLGLESLTAMDEFFLLDSPLNRCNVVTVIKLEKIRNYEKFKNNVARIVLTMPRTQHCVVKFLGNYFFKRLKHVDLNKHFVRLDGVHTQEQICDIVAREQCDREKLNGLLYKFIFVPDFSDTRSLIICKQHHSICDGIATLVMVSMLTDDGYKRENFPTLVRQQSCLQMIVNQIMQVVFLPYSIYLAQISIFKPETMNEIYTGKRLTGKRKAAYSQRLSTKEVVQNLKDRKLSLNDYVLACVTLALSQRCKSAKQIQVSMPFTLRDFPQNERQLQQGNYLACLPVTLQFPDRRSNQEIPLLCQQMKETRQSTKNKFLALGFYYMMNYFMAVLRWPLNFKPMNCADNYTTVVSTVPGSRKQLVLQGLKVYELFYFVPGSGRLACGISTITHNDYLQLAVNYDTSYDIDQEFVKNFEQIFIQAQNL